MNINISNIYSKPFNCKVESIPYIEMANEILENKVYDASETMYFKYMLNLLNSNRLVWGWIYTEEDCLERTNEFMDIAKSIKENGYVDKNKVRNISGLPYGKMTFINNGKIYLIDGHHRMAILICLGFTEFELRHNYLIPVKP